MKPLFKNIQIKKSKNTFFDFLKFLLLYYSGIFLGVLLILISKIILDISFPNNNHSSILFKRYPTIVYFGIVVFLGPFLEELIFRLFLNGKEFYLKISASLGLLAYGSSFLYIETLFSINNLYLVAVSIIIILIPNHFLLFFSNFIKNRKKLIILFSALLFSFAHYKRMGLSLNQFYLFPIYLFSYFWSGLVFGYYRLRNGFFFALICHVVVNFLSYIWEM